MPASTPVMMEGVRIIFRNFKGREGPYNKEGERNFAVLLDDEIANAMAADEWNVKWLEPRPEEEDETRQAILPVALRYDIFPPRIVLVTSRNRTVLEESQLEVLDDANILDVDLIVRPYAWGPYNGKSGIKAYVKTMYITIEEDPLDAKYAAMDEEK